ncbi:hypothetical protein ACWGNM_14275 [Streptomyces sp. NPDC055796]
MDAEFISGQELNPYRTELTGSCWWCGNDAETAEHKFKHSDLRRLNADGVGLLWGDGEKLESIRSLRKSSRVRFTSNLCASCNNARSQKFDRAYDRFAEHIWERSDRLHSSRFIDMADIYGSDWPSSTVDLARYVVKHMGCRMEADGFAVPPEFGSFLDGSDLLHSVQMVTFKDRDAWKTQRRLGKVSTVSIGPGLGSVSPSLGRLTTFSSSILIGYVGIFYRWQLESTESDPFYRYKKARLHWKSQLPLM